MMAAHMADSGGTKMKCSKCGTDNPTGKSVCRKCGNFLYSSNPHNRVPLTPEQKKARRKMIFKGSALGCFWTILIVVGMFIVIGVITYLLVRFVLPEDFFSSMTETSISETYTGTTSETAPTTSSTSG
jgi:uncharacterized membrane protein YvbJ